MNVQIKPVSYSDKIELEEILTIYNEAFPADERRSRQQLEDLLKYESRMHVSAISDSDHIIGLLIIWKFDKFSYGEHFAMAETSRNQGYASVVLQKYILPDNPKFILECEPPTTSLAQRRIAFYQRMGLELSDVSYIQPAYDSGKNELSLMLMSQDMSREEILEAITIIHKEVYKK